MAYLDVKNVRLSGISACVPKTIEENINYHLFQNDEALKFISTTGVERHRLANNQTTTADLCFHAAEQLLKDISWNKNEIDCLIFVTQTPDYILPASSCLLQDRLKLSTDCYALDISMGCSGWIYGLSVIASLMQNNSFKKGLLLVGDSVTKFCSNNDKSTWPLFGDAGTATCLEFNEKSYGFNFHLATDGSGYEAIKISDGGYRVPFNELSLIEHEIEFGIARSNVQLFLNGMDVFSFGISKAPETIDKLCEHFNIDKNSIDIFVFHQANLFMNEKIRKKLKLPPEKVPYSLKDFGNTSSASIPLTLVTECNKNLINKKQKVIACGFGVGLSWGSVYFDLSNIVCSTLIEI
ncbi:MAG: ketoacyl-ACP synthase III [Bacteroidales bacterium]|nr:ketoacyl-ACP synthase III [Bacteroidales bacterium]